MDILKNTDLGQKSEYFNADCLRTSLPRLINERKYQFIQ